MARVSTCKAVVLSAWLVAAASTGCSAVAHPPWAPGGHGDNISAEDAYRVVFADETLEQHDLVRVTKVVAARKANNKLRIYCELLNRSKRDIRIQAQTAFKDGRGRIIEETPWHTVVMAARVDTSFTVSSTTMEADDYLIRIRLATPAVVFD